MKVLAGNANVPLATKIANYLKIKLTKASIRRFSDNEIFLSSSKISFNSFIELNINS